MTTTLKLVKRGDQHPQIVADERPGDIVLGTFSTLSGEALVEGLIGYFFDREIPTEETTISVWAVDSYWDYEAHTYFCDGVFTPSQ